LYFNEQAKKKQIETTAIEDYGVNLTPLNEVVSVLEPPTRSAGVMVANVDELLDKLRNEAKVL
jgi:electron transfer flavoprotein beta subunit